MVPNVRSFFAIAAVLLAAAPAVARAQTATQLVRIEIRPVNQIALQGTTSFTIPARVRTAAPATTSASATYAITTNEENRRIVVALDEALPEGVTLSMRMAAPAGAQSEEEVMLSAAAQPAVTGISRLNAKDLGIDYRLTASSGSVIPSALTRRVSITLVSGS